MDFTVYKIMRLHRLSFHLFPGLCVNCGLPSRRRIDLCAGCQATLPPAAAGCRLCVHPLEVPGICGRCLRSPPDFVSLFAPFSYQPPLSDLILELKYGGRQATGAVLGTLLAEALKEWLTPEATPDLIVPVPLHWRRRLSRGFNQAREIAAAVAAGLAIPLAPGVARRVAHTPPQEKLGRRQRERNLRRAFAASPRVRGQSVAIVDDVVTSTATVRALSTTLAETGADRIQVWCLARTTLEKDWLHPDNAPDHSP